MQTRSRLGLVLACVLAASVAVAAPASATSATSLLHTTIPAAPNGTPATKTSVVRLPSMTLNDGWHMYMHAQYTATESSPVKILQAAQIWCSTTGSTIMSQYTTTNRYSGSGTGSVQVRWIFNVPVTGIWSCELVGWAASTGTASGDYLTIASGASNTYLYVNDTPDNGLGWIDTAANTSVAPGGYTYVARQTWPATAPTPAPSSVISVMAEAEVTVDYTVASDTAVVTPTLYVNQISGSRICKTNGPYTQSAVTITSYIHHYKFYLNALNIPVSSACPNQWAIKVLVQNAGPKQITTNQAGYSAGLAVWGPAP